MGTWNDLPVELMIIILRLLDHERVSVPNRDIICCTYVSHMLRDIAEPFLYREVDVELTSDGDLLQLRSLARTIASRPQLGEYVQHLDIPSLPDGSYDSEDIDFILTSDDVEYIIGTETNEFDEDLTILLDAATRLGLPNNLIIDGGSVGELSLLLHLLPCLQTLKLRLRNDVCLIATSALGGFAGGMPVALQSISELSLFYDDYEGGFSLENVMPFMMLPSLTSFTVSGFMGEECDQRLQIGGPDNYGIDTGVTNNKIGKRPHSLDSSLADHTTKRAKVTKTTSGYTLTPKSSSMTNLDLVMSRVSGALLGRVLTLPAALERFKYEVDGAFNPSKFLPGLVTQATSLKELVIDARYSDERGRDESTFGSFAELRGLERLAVPVAMLVGNEHLRANVAAAQNPFDAILPPLLVTLELDLTPELDIRRGSPYGLGPLLNVLGIPKTLPITARRIPTLRHLIISRTKYPATFQIREAALAEASRICPQITLEFK